MFEPLKTQELNQLLHMAVEKHGLDPNKTYVEFTWWDHVFRPMTDFDCNREKSWGILVFGKDNCNLFYKSSSLPVVPTAFWINKDAVYADQVVHRPTAVGWLMDNPMLLEFETAKFLFSNSPINYYVDIDPFRTKVYKNLAGDAVLALYAEDRDSGEWRPFSEMRPECIKLVDDSRKTETALQGDRP